MPNSITVREAELKPFIEYQYSFYKDTPLWIPELKKSALMLLDTEKHPFWRHGERRLFMAWSGGKPVGRVAAIINRNHNEYQGDKCGFFGFFECVNNLAVSRALLSAAAAWLKERGMETMRGPMNPSTNETCGLLISGFDSAPKFMMPYNPAYYAVHFEEFGLAKAKDLNAYVRFVPGPVSMRIEKILSRIEARQDYRIRPIRMASLEHELAVVRNIYNDAWSENWGFVPMTAEEMDLMAKELKPILKPEYAYILEVDNEPAAFSLTVPDLNVAFAKIKGNLTPLNFLPFLFGISRIKQGRLLTLGVRKEFRARGLELLLVRQLIRTAEKLGWNHAELSWILEDNAKIISVIEECGGQLYKQYRVYDKPLSHDADEPLLAVQSQL